MDHVIHADAPPACAAAPCSSPPTRSSPLLAQECYHTRAGIGEDTATLNSSSGARRMRRLDRQRGETGPPIGRRQRSSTPGLMSGSQQRPIAGGSVVADAPSPRARRPPLLEPVHSVLTTPGPRVLPHQGRDRGGTKVVQLQQRGAGHCG
jgi:hypothetical protein